MTEQTTHNKEKRTDVFLFVDALGWDLVSVTNYLSELLPYRREVTMQFGYSCSAIPTILTGKRPETHGHLGLFRYSPADSPFKKIAKFGWLLHPKSFWDRGRVRGHLSKLVKKVLGFTGYFQLYQMSPEKLKYMDYCEKKNLFVEKGLGEVKNLADVLAEQSRSYHISDWHNSDAKNLEIGLDEIRLGTEFLFLYTAELDAIRHDYANENILQAVIYKLEWYRQRITALVDALKATGRKWSLTVFSDHGMTPLTKTVNLKKAVESTGLVFGEDYGVCYDSTLLRVHFLKPGVQEIIEKAIEPFEADGHWLTEEEERRFGIYREDRQFGDKLFLTNPGIQIVPSDMGLQPLNGMHGFAPEDAHSRAAILSSEPIPNFVQGVYNYFDLMMEKLNGN